MKTEILQIRSVAYGGSGVAAGADGRVCFIPNTLPHETVEAEITAEKKRFSFARAIRIVTPSPHRQEAPCSHAAHCPGCAYMHCTYEYEVALKQQQLHDFLIRRNIAAPENILAPFASPGRTGNRNKLVLKSSGSTRGYTGHDGTHLPVSACLLAVPAINDFLSANPPQLPRETLRHTPADGVINAALCEKEYLTETIPNAGDFQVSPAGFFQTNIFVAAELVRRAVAEIAASKLKQLVELYCGVGVFSIAAAAKIPDLTAYGIEFDATAVKFAKRNAVTHKVSARCRFVSGDAGKKLAALGRCRNAVMLLDPPRAGISSETMRNILQAEPAKIIYISCAPDTLARDLEKFISGGYIVKNAGLLDMFPGTAHFEVMSILEKR